jgi:hypothetical protein
MLRQDSFASLPDVVNGTKGALVQVNKTRRQSDQVLEPPGIFPRQIQTLRYLAKAFICDPECPPPECCAGGTADGLCREYRGSLEPWLHLSCTVLATGEQIEGRNQLVTTSLHSGGLRWWFLCPLITTGQACQARVKKLYLQPGARYFGCRTCYDLTYTSCQTHEKPFDGTLRGLYG